MTRFPSGITVDEVEARLEATSSEVLLMTRMQLSGPAGFALRARLDVSIYRLEVLLDGELRRRGF